MTEGAEEDAVPRAGIQSLSWEQQYQRSGWHSLLPSNNNTDIVVFQDVPNRRLQVSEHLRTFLDATSGAAGHDPISNAMLESDTTQTGLDPETAVSLVHAAGYEGMIVPSPKTPIAFDLIVFRASALLRSAARNWVFTRLSEFHAQQSPCRRETMSQRTRRSMLMHLFHKVPHYVSGYTYPDTPPALS